MRVTFTAADGEVSVWDFDPDDVMQSQCEIVEKRYGRDWDSFLVDVRSGNSRARRVLLWHLQRQTHHTLRFEDLPDFRIGAIKVTHSVAELVEVRTKVEKSSLSDTDREGVLALLDVEITEAMAEQEPGKAPDTEASTTSPD